MATSTEVKLPEGFNHGRLLSRRQISEFLGVHIVTVDRLLKSKKDPLPSIKIGKSRKFQLDKVQWWIDNRSAKEIQ